MNGINSVILIKQIYYEMDLFFSPNVGSNLERNKLLFNSYLGEVINYYKPHMPRNYDDNHFSEEFAILEEKLFKTENHSIDEWFETDDKITISKLRNVQILLSILEFFVGRGVARKFVYN